MAMEVPRTLLRLWSSSGNTPESPNPEWKGEFEPVGLILQAPLKNGGYWCTPANSWCFAWTGGDGVHFSLLDLGSGLSDTSPIVMTVPMADAPNVILGEDLREFLALGCRSGYFSLEQLVYRREAAIEKLKRKRFASEWGREDLALLTRISKEFDLVPWAEPERRLRDLEAQFGALLTLPPRVG